MENLNTLAEMNRTAMENIIPRGSRIRVKIIGVWDIFIKFHSSKNVWYFITIWIVGSVKDMSISQIITLA